MISSEKNDELFGVNVLGHVTGEFGMGQAIRSTIQALEAVNIPVAIRDFKVKWHRNLDDSYTNFSNHNPYPINLIHINPGKLLDSIEPEYFKNKYNIGFWEWELLEFPSSWYSAFERFDEIWTPSSYTASALAQASPIPIVKMPHTIDLSQPSIGRQALGLPKSKFIFLFMFDFRSTFARKNPLAVVKAFKKAFGDSRDVMLILKFSNADAFPEKRAELLKNIDNDKSIYTINKHLMKEEIHGLINSCNCYISLHRAEGFGLTMAEAMFYGKPVVSTGYSSNIEFMNVSNSFLVKYKLIKNPQDEGLYTKGCVWADPDIDHAAFLMKYVFENYEESQKFGEKAARDIRSLLNPKKIGCRIKNRIDYIMDKKIKALRDSNHNHDIQAEIETLRNQLQAWEKTKTRITINVQKYRHELIRSTAHIDNDKDSMYLKNSYRLGVNIIGHITGEFGLGEGARCLVKSMEAAGIPFKIVKDFQVPWHRNLDTTYSEDIVDQDDYPINLVYTNPDAHVLNNIINSLSQEYFKNKYNIGFWAWELRKLPTEWQFAFDLFDEIWTLSNYCAESISASSPVPVMPVRPSIKLPQPSLTREDLNLPKDKFIFLFMFDFHSALERKNPLGTIEAFKRAFGKSSKDVMLLIKSSNAQWQPQKRDLLYALAEGYPTIKFMDVHLNKDQVKALIYNCDCYVSLHRAEGFGLPPAEAMFYGKPVIATGYSGNTEFMNIANSFLVKYSLVTTPEGVAGLYKQGDIWAEPDIDHAASLMKYIVDNYEEALKVGEQASCDVKKLLSPEYTGKVVKSRLEYITNTIMPPKINTQICYNNSGKYYYDSQLNAWKQFAKQLQKQLNKVCRESKISRF